MCSPRPDDQNAAMKHVKGDGLGGAISSGAKVKRAFLSMKRRISQADAERSIPGRGRVTQTRPL